MDLFSFTNFKPTASTRFIFSDFPQLLVTQPFAERGGGGVKKD